MSLVPRLQLRYATDSGGPVYSVDLQPALPPQWRSLPTGPLPHLAGPTWAARVHERLQIAFGASPAAAAANMTAPLLLLQGDADEEVAFDEMVGTVRALRRAGLRPEIGVWPDESHGLGAYRHQCEAYERTAAFLWKQLLPTIKS